MSCEKAASRAFLGALLITIVIIFPSSAQTQYKEKIFVFQKPQIF